VKDRLTEELLAMRAAQEIKPGDYCNLGIGLPQLCASHVPEGAIVQAENGTLGYGPLVDQDNVDKMDLDFIDAGGSFLTTSNHHKRSQNIKKRHSGCGGNILC